MMFELFPEVIYSLFIILIGSNVVNLVMGRTFAGLYARLGNVQGKFLLPLIFMICIIGSYCFRGNSYNIIAMIVFVAIGYLTRILKIPDAPMVITFLVTPMMEANLRKALLLGHGNWLHSLF